jgi:hypothetical protein
MLIKTPLSADPYSLNISLIVVSSSKNTELEFSKNYFEFFFMSSIFKLILDQIEIQSLSPHALKFNSSSLSLSSKIEMNLANGLLTNRSTFCRATTLLGDIKFFEVQLISMNVVFCNFLKSSFPTDVDIFDVQLWVNTSSSNSFALSSNTQTILVAKEEINWKSKRVVSPENPSMKLNFLLPMRLFDYSLEFSQHNRSISCNFTYGYDPTCILPLDFVKTIASIPSDLKVSLYVKKFNKFIEIKCQYLTYYELTAIQHLKPFFITYYEKLNSPLRLISNTLRSLNSNDFKFLCNGKFNII